MAEGENGIVQIRQLGTDVLRAKYPQPGSPAGDAEEGTCALSTKKFETNCLGRGDWGIRAHSGPAPEGTQPLYSFGTSGYALLKFCGSNDPLGLVFSEVGHIRVCGVTGVYHSHH